MTHHASASKPKVVSTADRIREAAEGDLAKFIHLVAPTRLLGDIHHEVIQWWNRPTAKSHQLLLLPRDHQKVLPLTEPVLMSDGSWKLTGDLKEGDKLADPVTGGSQHVTQLHPLGEDDYYTITLDDGRTVTAGAGHLWEIEQHGFKDANPIVRDTLWIKKHYKRQRVEKRTGNDFTEYKTALRAPKPFLFSKKHLPIDPYVLGVWLGDGTSRSGQITSGTPEIPGLVAAYGYEVTPLSRKYAYGVKGLQKQLKELNVLRNKHIPKTYLESSDSQRLELLKGLLDTDGNINKQNGIVSFTQCAKRKVLVEAVAYLVRSLGGKAKVHKGFTQDGVTEKQHESYTVNIWLPRSVGTPFKIPYKAETYEQVARFKPQMLKSYITDIQYAGRQVSRCISVSGERGLYTCNNFITTHNSVLMAYRVAWEITRDPTTTVLYVSATTTLAEKQLYFIKNIFLSEKYRKYWPSMVRKNESAREKWTNTEIIVDHPLRRANPDKDATIFAAGLTTNITGLHFKIAVLDDIVVAENAYSDEGRSKTERLYSLLASIETTGSREWIVGTRYHPRDLYGTLMKKEYEVFNNKGDVIHIEPLYEVMERKVEESRRGIGPFLWPKSKAPNGRWYGFDANELARKRAQYLDRVQFFAQYYNDPNDPSLSRFGAEDFQHYDQKYIKQVDGKWTFQGRYLNVYAAIDFAFSLKHTSDYTAIVVIGMDYESNVYILDIDRFKTDRISEYFAHIRKMHVKWDIRKLRAETVGGQRAIVRELKDGYIRPHGLVLSVDEFSPSRKEGSKEERIAAILETRYDDKKIWHFVGGLCTALENELISPNPEHDDLKDALAAAVSIAVPPLHRSKTSMSSSTKKLQFNNRFGGVSL